MACVFVHFLFALVVFLQTVIAIESISHIGIGLELGVHDGRSRCREHFFLELMNGWQKFLCGWLTWLDQIVLGNCALLQDIRLHLLAGSVVCYVSEWVGGWLVG